MTLQNKSEQKRPSLLIFFMACFMMISPIFLMFVFVMKLKTLDCIDITNKMYMLLGISFFYAYVIKNYFTFVWRKDENN
jgi:magnesium-transporting ATPase (P-type)